MHMPRTPNSELTPTTVLTTPALLISSGHAGSLQKHSMLMWRSQLYRRSGHKSGSTEESLSRMRCSRRSAPAQTPSEKTKQQSKAKPELKLRHCAISATLPTGPRALSNIVHELVYSVTSTTLIWGSAACTVFILLLPCAKKQDVA